MRLIGTGAFTATDRVVASGQLTYWTWYQAIFRDEADQIRDEADLRKIRTASLVRRAVHFVPMTQQGALHDPQTIG
jgi:hypothetical protein